MNEEIPFNAWSREKIEQGKKICTSRHKRYTKDKRVFWIGPKLPLWFICKYLWRDEGAESTLRLRKVFNAIYHREVPDDECFYVHFGNFKKSLACQKANKGNEKR